jgi:uncharacterized SAM-binding protein YcdF (DUF218 family)
MLRRTLSLLLLGWALGFIWFAVALPRARSGGRTDAVVVLTGGEGRIARGLLVLDKGWAKRLLVSGVDREVRPREFAAEYKVAAARMACCVTLGFEAVDTRSNARETARWIAANRFRSVRLVTTDWHMRRAAAELSRRLPKAVTMLLDAVPSKPSLRTLFLEYNKLLARLVSRLWEG